MSINVNVSGNPVSIHRGTMVTSDPDYSRKEFQKRRRMRLEQVRQQSKDIAESVRNKVRQEKCKQISDLEKQGEKEHRKWQARKLLELQQQYRECLSDIGLGHVQAVVEDESDCAMQARNEDYKEIAKERGLQAADRLQRQRYQEHSEQLNCVQKRRHNQLVEDTRAKMVANLHQVKNKSPFKKKKKRKVSTDINICSRVSSESETENEVPQLLNIASSHSGSIMSPSKLASKSSEQINPSRISEESTQVPSTSSGMILPSRHVNHSTQPPGRDRTSKPYGSSPEKARCDDFSRTSLHYPYDTRISDRIKNRPILTDHNRHCDMPCAHRTAHRVYSNHQLPTKKNLPSTQSDVKPPCFEQEQDPNFVKLCAESDFKKSQVETDPEQIPHKPTVSLRTKPESSSNLKSTFHSLSGANSNFNNNKVQYYDHKNRFTKEYVADEASVQKIPYDSIEVCPSTGSEAEFIERVYKRDRDAEIRGQKALKKEKVRRDYQEIMQQLPTLQKHERIASIPFNKPTFHMSEDRLKEHQRKRQNQMENAYEKLFPRPAIITIPARNVIPPKQTSVANLLPFQAIDVTDSPPTLNVGSWDFDVLLNVAPPNSASKSVESEVLREAAEEVLGEKMDPEVSTSKRRESLREMLRSLTFHRDKLAKELSSLPEDSNLHKLVSDLQNVDRVIQEGKRAEEEAAKLSRRKRARNRGKRSKEDDNCCKVSSSTQSLLCEKVDESQKGAEKGRERSREKERRISKYHTRCTSTSSSSPSPPSKIVSTAKTKAERKLSRPPPIILQNTSTQTTPAVERQSKQVTEKDSNKPKERPKSSDSKSSKKSSNKKACDCYLDPENTRKDKANLCEIIIKIGEDGKPQICVSPTKTNGSQVTVTTKEAPAVCVEPTKQPVKPSEPLPLHPPDKSEKSKLKPLAKQKIPDKQVNIKDSREDSVKDKRPSKLNQKARSSWREYFSQNSTSSTSYFSPPDFTSTQRRHEAAPEATQQSKPKSSRHLVDFLKDKPQQSNVLNGSEASTQSCVFQKSTKHPHGRLVNYVERLLTMSRASIDDLTVSSVSDVTTPSSSIVNVEPNNPMKHLHDIMKHFNVNLSDIEDFLNYSSDVNSHMHYNTVDSLGVSSVESDCCKDTCEGKAIKPVTSQDVREESVDGNAPDNCAEFVEAYNKLAAHSVKKIENLVTMIEKVRLEKVSILHSSPGSGSDKESSTRYLDLPRELKDKKTEYESKTPSPDSIREQEELDRQLLQIDHNFAESIKKLTPAQLREQFPLTLSSNSSSPSLSGDTQQDSIELALMTRFKNLTGAPKPDDSAPSSHASQTTGPHKTSEAQTQDNVPAFVPFLLDIPHLPKLDVPTAGLQRGNERSKPPPSKGLTTARRFNNNINVVPHELSTIVESESLVSNRLRSDSRSSKRESPQKDIDLHEDLGKVVALPETIDVACGCQTVVEPLDLGSSAKLQVSSSDSLPDILSELRRTVSTQMEKLSDKSKERSSVSRGATARAEPASDSSASEPENIEAMLHSLGMSWGVATWKKTHEALALMSSSSSSIDNSLKQKNVRVADSSSGHSEVSLKGIVSRQFLTKLTSNSVTTEESSSSSQFFREFQDLSAIQGLEVSHERTSRRTSTPVQSSKTPEKSKNDSIVRLAVTGESELSSVKVNSDDNIVNLGVPFYSLNESSTRSVDSTKYE